MPGKTGLDIIKDLKQTHPNLPILILSMHPEERFAVRVLKAGASGYINKNSVNEELTKAIRVVVTEKRRFISQAVGDQLADFVLSDEHPTLHESLSDREYQVLCMIATGKKIGAIAEELSLSAQTIHTYRARLKEKMNMKSNAEMIRYAIDQNLVD
jgi:DNA-binding NarL/FixJ family response regulator